MKTKYQVLVEDGHCGLTIRKVYYDDFDTEAEACVKANRLNSDNPANRAVVTHAFDQGTTHKLYGKTWIVRAIRENLIILKWDALWDGKKLTGNWEIDNLFVTRES